MTIGRKAIVGGLWLSGASYARFGLNFLINLLLARMLVPEVFGLYAIIAGIVEILFIGAALVSPQSVLRFQANKHIYPTALNLSWWIGAGTLLVIIIGLTFCYSLDIGSLQTLSAIAALSVFRVLNLPASIYEIWIEKNLEFRFISFSILVVSIIGAFVGVGAALSGFGLWSLLLKEMAETFCHFLIMRLAALKETAPRFNKDTALVLFEYGKEFFAMRLMGVVGAHSPFLLIGWGANLAVSGFYNRAFYVANVQERLLMPITHRVSRSVYGKVQDNADQLSKSLTWHLYIATRWSLFSSFVLYVFAEEILLFLLGPQWQGATGFLKGFCLFVALRPCCLAMEVCCQTFDRPKPVFISNSITLFAVVIGFIWGYFMGWYEAVAWAVSLSVLVRLGFLGSYLYNKGLRPDYVKVFRVPCLLLILFGFILWVFYSLDVAWWQCFLVFAILWGGLIGLIEKDELLFLKQQLFQNSKLKNKSKTTE